MSALKPCYICQLCFDCLHWNCYWKFFSLLQQEIRNPIIRHYCKNERSILAILLRSFDLFFLHLISLTWYSNMTNGGWRYKYGECFLEWFLIWAVNRHASSNSNTNLKLQQWLYIPQYHTRYSFQWITVSILMTIQDNTIRTIVALHVLSWSFSFGTVQPWKDLIKIPFLPSLATFQS